MAPRLPDMLLESYQIEFETTNISILELCEKHDVTTKQLRGYTKWSKQSPHPIEALPAQSVEVELVSSEPIEAVDELSEMKSKIVEAKKLALDHALDFFKGDGINPAPAKYAEIKEFKDVVSIIDTLDKSLDKRTPDAPNQIVLIQNIMNGFKDDC